MTLFHIVWTVLLFGAFIGIVLWAWNARQKDRFQEAANIPLNEDDVGNGRF